MRNPTHLVIPYNKDTDLKTAAYEVTDKHGTKSSVASKFFKYHPEHNKVAVVDFAAVKVYELALEPVVKEVRE